jgi:hypothetical protein
MFIIFNKIKFLASFLVLSSLLLGMPPKRKMTQAEEDALLDQLMQQTAMTAPPAVTKKETSPIVTKKQIENALDTFLERCNPLSPNITKTGKEIIDSKKCTVKDLDVILKQSINLDLNAIWSLYVLCKNANVQVNGQVPLVANFGIIYKELLNIQKDKKLPVEFFLALNQDSASNINNHTYDSRFIRLLDILKKNFSSYAGLIEQGYYKQSIDGEKITEENKLIIMAKLYHLELNKKDCTPFERNRSLYMLANFVFKNGLSLHPDGKTDLSTLKKRVEFAAKLYLVTQYYGELADCLVFLDHHPDQQTDISTPLQKGTEIIKLYLLAIKKSEEHFLTAREGMEKNAILQRKRGFLANIGSHILKYRLTIDPETNRSVNSHIQLAAKYWWKSETNVAKDFLVKFILSGQLRYHPITLECIQDPDLLAFSLLSNSEPVSNSFILLENGERVSHQLSIETKQDAHLVLWRLISKEKIDTYKSKKLKKTEDRLEAIIDDFQAMSEDDQNDPRVHLGLGIAYMLLKEYKTARPHFEYALENGYDCIDNLSYCLEELEKITPPVHQEGKVERSSPYLHFQLFDETISPEEIAQKRRIIEERKRLKRERKSQQEPQRTIIEAHSDDIPFKIDIIKIEMADNVLLQKNEIERILPGKTDQIIKELEETGWARGSKPIGRYPIFDNQLLIEVKMNAEHRLFYSRDTEGVVTIHKIGGHTPD